jgi:hypothetical protein
LLDVNGSFTVFQYVGHIILCNQLSEKKLFLINDLSV